MEFKKKHQGFVVAVIQIIAVLLALTFATEVYAHGERAQQAHEPRLQAHVRIAHVALELGLGHERGDGVDDEHVDGAGADERLRDLERLLSRVGLGDEQIVGIDADLPCIIHVEGVLGVDEGRQAVLFLRLRDDVEGQGRLPARFGSEDLDDPSPGHSTRPERHVEADRAGGNRGDIGDHLAAAQPHDRPFPKLPLDLGDCQIDRLFSLRRIRSHSRLPCLRPWFCLR